MARKIYFANPLRMSNESRCLLVSKRLVETQTEGLLRLRIKSYLVRLGENPLDFPLDKVLKIERQEAMKPNGKRVCQKAISDISARFRVSPVMTTSISLHILLSLMHIKCLNSIT